MRRTAQVLALSLLAACFALRLACIGGSTTVQVPGDDATYPARLEAR